MADNQNTTVVRNNTFTKGMIKDMIELFNAEGVWTHARNAVNNTDLGQLGEIGNEPANYRMIRLPYPLVGAVHKSDDKWIFFSSDEVDSEIGEFDESDNSYKKIINARCLNFSASHLITGVARKNFDCTVSVYFDDGVNPTRVLNLDRIPYQKKQGAAKKNCVTPEYTTQLDCEALRLATLVTPPCVSVEKSTSGGSMPNGSYQFAVAYTVNTQRVTDYLALSNVQALFAKQNAAGGLEVKLSGFDSDFDEFELVMISTIAENVTTRRIGFYSTRQASILVDKLDETLPVVDITMIAQRTPAFERSDALYELNGYLLRTGIYTKPDINYQPQAAKIQAKWVAAEVPADYYIKGGNLTSYMRDEVYSFFIRWVYNTGEKTASFHIPGRVANPRDLRSVAGRDAIENQVKGESAKAWEVNDTSERTSKKQYKLDNEALVVAEGNMAYWESSERYPDDKPQIWGDLCGQQIRHHKFPDNATVHIHDSTGSKIVLLGVKFEGITHPLDSQGKPDNSIIGYEILRGSRQGNKTVIAKGLLNNMGEYDIDPDVSTRKGLYANYPFNDLRVDPFLSKKPVKGGCKGKDYEPMGTFKNNIFSFHSPETQFRDPFLNPYELKIHGELSGVSTNKYSPVFRHPKHKMLTDLALIVSSLAGIASGMLLIKGKTTKTKLPNKTTGTNLTIAGVAAGQVLSVNPGTDASTKAAIATYERLDNAYRRNVLPVVNAILKRARDNAYRAAMSAVDNIPSNGDKSTSTVTEEPGALDNMPLALSIANEVFLFTYYFSQGTEAALKIMKAVVPFFQYAYQLNAHGFYNTYTAPRASNRRRSVTRANYINPYLQEFGPDYRINNLFRSRFVAIETDGDLATPLVRDQSRQTIGNLALWSDPTRSFSTPISGHYASLKIKMRNQYGQLDGISQIPVSTCVSYTKAVDKVKYNSPVYFGGDIYINRYTEKNTFFFFNDWLFAEQDGSPFNYMSYSNIPYPRYWIDTNEYDITQLPQAVTGGKALPNDLASLDRSAASCRSKIAFRIKDAYFYLFANGVRDFFVESEINLAYREHGDVISERHYDPYDFTDLPELFRSDVIKSGNYFKYDYSLSVSKLFGNAISWGNMQPRDYDPKIASTCYAYYPKRVIYSLPQLDEQKKDNWKVFLSNNYKDLDGDVTTIKGVNQSGAMILFKKDSPVFFNGVDQLQTTGGIKITVGDGGLFNQPLQQVSNAESVYQYGSCQSRLSVINTPAGLFWVSQNQGKVFQYGQGLKEISRNGMKWWFTKYLPSYLLKDFPDFQLYDNPVKGVGCMLTYDNTNDILYLCKKDYRLRDQYKGVVVYSHDNVFLRGGIKVYLGDPVYFEDASFTISYDPKAGENGVWISHHDWHPDFALPSRSHFMTVKNGGLWKHNDRCDLYCNFYGVDYPFEIEFVATTGQEVSILKSVEYQLECYKYDNDCRDLHHILDYNFDRAVIYNTEQVSGQLNLINKPKNDPLSLIDYPIVRQNSIDIIYAKEENKYRFNQFYDITRNRGEFQETDRPVWDTAANGYDRELNSLYLNYQKKDLQHKKFRHYLHRILMKRMVSNDVKMLFRMSAMKVNKSDR